MLWRNGDMGAVVSNNLTYNKKLYRKAYSSM